MAPHTENQKLCSSKTEKEKIQDELMEKLKLDEEREKKKIEKEAKRRAELEKIKKESLERQATLLVPLKKQKQTIQSKVIKSQPKKSNKKQQSQNSQNKNNQSSSYESKAYNSNPKSLAWNSQQSHNESRVRHNSTSSEYSWKRDDGRRSRSSSYASDSIWGDMQNHFPVLGVEAPVPQVNVWEKRKTKQEENKVLEPRNQYDEEVMLQRALALSMMEATEEQERQRKLEEECRLQMAALEVNPKLLEELNVAEEFITADKCELEYRNALKSAEEPKQNFSKSVARPGFIQKNNFCNSSKSGGARPKLNKIIDSFGGWGLKTVSKEKSSEKLTNFVDVVVNEEPSKNSEIYYTSSGCHQNTFDKNVKKSEIGDGPWNTSDTKPGVSGSWSNSNDNKKPSSVSDPWESEVLYDEKGTFTDIDDAKQDFTSSLPDYNSTASHAKKHEFLNEESGDNKLDKWLDSVDEFAPVSNGWEDTDVHDEKQSHENMKRDSFVRLGSVAINNADTKWENSKTSSSGFETYSSVKECKFDSDSSKLNDNLHISTQIFESSKGTLSGTHCNKKQNELSHGNVLSQFKSTYDYIVGNESKSLDKTKAVKTFQNDDDIWSDKSSNKSTSSSAITHYSNPLKTQEVKEDPVQSDNIEDDGIFIPISSNEESDTPPILPPQPAPTIPPILPPQPANEGNQATEISNVESAEILPDNLPSQTSSEIPSPYPAMFNPVFPGISPMLGLGLDPITMRQMLMLSNPFFASQLLAMEQYYRALGMPVDLFSFPTQTMPTMPFQGLMGASMGQNIFPNTANVNASDAQDPQLQNHFQDQPVPMPENQNSSSVEKSSKKYPLGCNENGDAANNPTSLDNDDTDSWYSSLLSNDSASVIPPPKPPCLETGYSSSIPEQLEPGQSAFDFNSTKTIQNICGSSSTNLSQVESHTSFSAVEANITKPEISGWGDLDEQPLDKNKSKAHTWNDDGWGDNSLPAKSVKNHSVYDEKKKVVHRQPARQPQFSRFQSSRKYN